MTRLPGKNTLSEVLVTQRFGVLATENDHQPYTNLLAYGVNSDLSVIVFATNRDTSKYRNIHKNGRVAFLVNNSKNETADLTGAVSITALGIAVEVEKDNFYTKLYIDRHPNLLRFIKKERTALIALKVSVYVIAGFNSVNKIKPVKESEAI
jgi:nitroimidazol reductase NimA-like FMN-containing flavoprotein (pyridoxamine 5'-phosphate oxidase superfamily)